MLEFTLLVLIATFLYFGGFEGVISLLAGTFSIVLIFFITFLLLLEF